MTTSTPAARRSPRAPQLTLWLLASLTLGAVGPVLAPACLPTPAECDDDADCGAARVCANGSCVACAVNDDCGADQFCCSGQCFASADIGRHCGCGPAVGGNPGSDCSTLEPAGVCLVGDATATAANVSSGQCDCGCTPALGGPICGDPATAGDPPVCSCADNADCREASADAGGRPHRSTDTCTPDDKCVCFSVNAACDPDGPTPDCAGDRGCASLLTDAANCGVEARSCADDATGIASNATCTDGGCACDNATDCVGTALNVDACVFIGAGAQCVCGGYTRAGTQAPCPMGLECVAAGGATPAGCRLDGTVHTTEEALRAALGL